MAYLNRTERGGGALFLYSSANKKLSPVVKVPYNGKAKDKFPYRPEPRAPYCCSTYVSIDATCPDSCKFKRAKDGTPGGCYVDAGKTVFTIKRLDQESGTSSGDEVIVAEADLIDSAFKTEMPQDGARGGRDLRLHVGGDVASEDSTRFLADAITRWKKRGGGAVWTFTHRWAEIPREAFGAISVLASVEDPRDIPRARVRGYAPALVVTSHLSHLAKPVNGTRIIPCPAETRGTTCVECRLCLDDGLYSRNAGVSFALHGVHKPAALVRLGVRGVQRKLL